MAGEATVERKTLSPLDRNLAMAERLLAILKAETKALKGFEKERLLQLIVEKEAAANELAAGMEALASLPSSSEQEATGADEGKAGESHSKRAALKALLSKIVKANHRNQVFVQGSLDHWQELLALCLPGTYVFSHAGEAAKQSLPTKVLALNREI